MSERRIIIPGEPLPKPRPALTELMTAKLVANEALRMFEANRKIAEMDRIGALRRSMPKRRDGDE